MFNVIRTVDIWFLKRMHDKADKKSGRNNTDRRHGSRGKKVLPIGQRR